MPKKNGNIPHIQKYLYVYYKMPPFDKDYYAQVIRTKTNNIINNFMFINPYNENQLNELYDEHMKLINNIISNVNNNIFLKKIERDKLIQFINYKIDELDELNIKFKNDFY